jgi:hypothetical protein
MAKSKSKKSSKLSTATAAAGHMSSVATAAAAATTGGGQSSCRQSTWLSGATMVDDGGGGQGPSIATTAGAGRTQPSSNAAAGGASAGQGARLSSNTAGWAGPLIPKPVAIRLFQVDTKPRKNTVLEFPTTVAFWFADDQEDSTTDLTTSSTLRNLCDKIQATMQQRSEAYQPCNILGAGSWLFFWKKGLPKLHYSDSVLSLQSNKECFQVKKIDTHNPELASQPLSAFTSRHATAIMMHGTPESAGDDDDDPTIEKYILDVIVTVGKAATI